jgi:hypothetical protein
LLIGRFIGRLIGRFIGRFIGFIGRFIGFIGFIGRFIGRFVLLKAFWDVTGPYQGLSSGTRILPANNARAEDGRWNLLVLS